MFENDDCSLGRNAGETSASSRTRGEDTVCSERGKICVDERAAARSSNISESRGSMTSERQGRNLSIAELNTPFKTSALNSGFRHILVATDFSAPSRRALCNALVLASEND